MNKDKMIKDEELDNIAGGLIFNASNISGSDPTKPWEVLDNKNGNVLMRFSNETDAVNWVTSTYGNNALNTARVDWDYVQALRQNPLA